jgi:hypothetical protein
MAATIILAFSMVFAAVGGYYVGPGVGYYGAGAICVVLFLLILYRVFASGPKRKGMPITSQFEAPPEPSNRR